MLDSTQILELLLARGKDEAVTAQTAHQLAIGMLRRSHRPLSIGSHRRDLKRHAKVDDFIDSQKARW